MMLLTIPLALITRRAAHSIATQKDARTLADGRSAAKMQL
jgi:hypothetical protein